MEHHVTDTVRALREELHSLAERSGEEKKTKARLMKFLRENTSLGVTDEGKWFTALHREPGASETVALRADMDALPFGEGARHFCGHDGHSAALAGLGLLLEGKRLGRNILLVFQHAEETGAGGIVCSRALKAYGVNRAYSFHNIPGYPEGTVLTRRGVFACASRGMTLSFSGRVSHAAYPEYGRNPGFAAARLISALPELTAQAGGDGLVMATLAGARMGERAFGSAAGQAEVWLTLRTGLEKDMEALVSSLENAAQAEAARDGTGVSFSFCDVFPAMVNDPDAGSRLENACRAAGLLCEELPESFRWSEDFGHYVTAVPAAMAGIGAGIDWPQLHTADYTFNDRVLPAAMAFFYALAEQG